MTMTRQQRINAYHRRWCRTHKQAVKRNRKRWESRHPKQYRHMNRKGIARWYINQLNNIKEVKEFEVLTHNRAKQLKKGE